MYLNKDTLYFPIDSAPINIANLLEMSHLSRKSIIIFSVLKLALLGLANAEPKNANFTLQDESCFLAAWLVKNPEVGISGRRVILRPHHPVYKQ